MRGSGAIAPLWAAGRAGVLAGLLAGCTLWVPAPPAVAVSAGPDPAELRLAEAAERAVRALDSLSRALPAPDPGSAMPALASLPPALQRPVTIDWTGPLEGLARDLAKRAGYRFLMAGRLPARAPIVAVEADGEPLLAVLRDAGLQAGAAATLTVDAAAETVVLDWAGSAPREER